MRNFRRCTFPCRALGRPFRRWEILADLGTRRREPCRTTTTSRRVTDEPRGGSLSFKNGGSLAVKKKSKKSKKGSKSKEAAAEAAALSVGQGIGGDPGGDAKGTYEELFPYESKRQEEGKGRSNCWGTNYRQAPDVLHGYTTSWKGKKREEMTHEERLDLRCGSKADKFAK